MKIFISADIEGVAGSTLNVECHKERPEYAKFAEQMTLEVLAAIDGAVAAGADEIVVKDGHGSATNIDIMKMPKCVTLIRGKSGHPYNMMYGLDDTFDGVMFIGYHSGAGMPTSPLSHTNTGNPSSIEINGDHASEFMINSYIASMNKVPILFISGDQGICNAAKKLVPNITTVETKIGVGGSTINVSPKKVIDLIKGNVEKALKKDLSQNLLQLPTEFEDVIKFKDHKNAYKMSFYPKMEVVDSHTIKMITNNFMDIVTAHAFVLY
ncbi:M55 family metallopeptidase [Sedimentibacter sp. MB31-C6]|uniref:M55 family metallopeptidase n=1 Tax=Sedimentibacter sp. MB31-C6 TaxID=3109366 RepID=UPI002DDD21B9|nr:M55 family metallopeptidase [Sedimentibacter sp. MB36-C1]WSI05066.1 M55 family metallopeptidase [Sedimentibacter sp. MB36-C1]